MPTATQFQPESVLITDVIVADRVRSEMGDIDSLANSIKEFGGPLIHPIQPIVLACDELCSRIELVAGGRRLTALKRLGVKDLVHGLHFVWRQENLDGSEEVKLKMQGIELEENLRRKGLTWQEEVLAKKKLMETMQKIHGAPSIGGRTRAEIQSGQSAGFGVRTMASMLNESPATSSLDLQLASAMTAIPQLRSAPNKSAAVQLLTNLVNAASGKPSAATVAPSLSYRIIIHCADETEQVTLATELEARGLKIDLAIV